MSAGQDTGRYNDHIASLMGLLSSSVQSTHHVVSTLRTIMSTDTSTRALEVATETFVKREVLCSIGVTTDITVADIFSHISNSLFIISIMAQVIRW